MRFDKGMMRCLLFLEVILLYFQRWWDDTRKFSSGMLGFYSPWDSCIGRLIAS